MPAHLDSLPSALMAQHGTSGTPEPLLTPNQLADLLGVPRSWVYEKAAIGIIPSIKLGAYRRFRWSEIQKWLEEVNS